ncbi:WD40/YVTN/BNR-like repeat-containing protein [Marinobacter shengliensis]|uniref:WD40/YVTN/BNR-like repeat-containing protein n=1 Tax=Marinobacter shengliensis TaxID=1389223 RepID=UPI0011099B6E|nr:glycosyl hydrolase [Marinobacter shengliensis]
MKNTNLSLKFSAASLVVLLILISLSFAPRIYAGNGVLPDYTELPAMLSKDARHSVQLGLAKAGDRLVSVGEQGIVLLSDDHGETWRQSAGVPVSVTLTQVAFVSDLEGWAVGHSGVVLKTDSSGDQWVRVMTGNDLVEMIKSDVAGASWDDPEAQALKRNASYLNGTEPVLDLYFNDVGEGWLLGGYGIALRTRDLGKSWQSAFTAINNPNSSHLYKFVPSSEAGDLIVGERGFVASFSEASQTFEPIPIDYQGTFFGGVALSDGGYLLHGLRGNIWTGNGEGWARVNSGTESSFNASLSTPRGVVLGDVSGRLFLFSEKDNSLREFVESSDAAITDMTLNSRGELVVATGRGLKLLGLDNAEFK